MTNKTDNTESLAGVRQLTTDDLDSSWHEASRGWGHSLHKLAPYVGRFPPALAHYFIRWFSSEGDTVLDPFCGGGTVPLEACLTNRHGWGNDAFEYARVLSHAKCNPIPTPEVEQYLDKKLREADSIDNSNFRLLNNEDIQPFYSDYTLDQLLRLREVLTNDNTDEGIYLQALICGILHGPSNMFLSLPTKDTYSGSVDYIKDYADENDLERPQRDVRRCVLMKQHRVSHHPLNRPYKSRITGNDVRELPYRDESVDLVVTSPPYLRVLDYTWNNWIRLWWLNVDRDDERASLDLTASLSRYRTFIRESLAELYRVMAPNSIAAFVVGDVEKEMASETKLVVTAQIIAEEATQHTDFTPMAVINDAYEVANRSYVVFNQLKYDSDEEATSTVPIDRCIILTKGTPDIEFDNDPHINWQLKRYTGQRSLHRWA